jgi:hypothetical protein
MALLENNVRRRLPIYNSWKETLNYFVQQNSHTFTQRLHWRWYYKNDRSLKAIQLLISMLK